MEDSTLDCVEKSSPTQNNERGQRSDCASSNGESVVDEKSAPTQNIERGQRSDCASSNGESVVDKKSDLHSTTMNNELVPWNYYDCNNWKSGKKEEPDLNSCVKNNEQSQVSDPDSSNESGLKKYPVRGWELQDMLDIANEMKNQMMKNKDNYSMKMKAQYIELCHTILHGTVSSNTNFSDLGKMIRFAKCVPPGFPFSSILDQTSSTARASQSACEAQLTPALTADYEGSENTELLWDQTMMVPPTLSHPSSTESQNDDEAKEDTQ